MSFFKSVLKSTRQLNAEKSSNAESTGMILLMWVREQNSTTAIKRNMPNSIKKLSVEYNIDATNKMI